MIAEINLKRNFFSNSKIERLLNPLIKIFITSIVILIFAVSFSEAKEKEEEKDEKDCVYCNKYEKLKEWPENERPEAFIYEEVDYPEGMFKKNFIKQAKKNKEKLEKKYMQDL